MCKRISHSQIHILYSPGVDVFVLQLSLDKHAMTLYWTSLLLYIMFQIIIGIFV